MHDLKTYRRAALLIAAVFAVSACGRGKTEPDPAALDAHFNKMIAEDEAERRRLVEAARDREDVRNNEMEQRAQNYRDKAD